MEPQRHLASLTIRIVEREGGEVVFLTERDYSYTLVVRAPDDRKIIVKVARSVGDISQENVVDLKLISHYCEASPLAISQFVSDHPLRQGIVYEKGGINVVSLSTFRDALNGEMPRFKLVRGKYIASVRSDVLRSRREEKGMSLGDLATALSVSRNAVYAYEHGKMDVGEKVARKLLDLFGDEVLDRYDVFSAHINDGELSERASKGRIMFGDIVEEGDRVLWIERGHVDAIYLQRGKPMFLSTRRDEETREFADAIGVQLVEISGNEDRRG